MFITFPFRLEPGTVYQVSHKILCIRRTTYVVYVGNCGRSRHRVILYHTWYMQQRGSTPPDWLALRRLGDGTSRLLDLWYRRMTLASAVLLYDMNTYVRNTNDT